MKLGELNTSPVTGRAVSDQQLIWDAIGLLATALAVGFLVATPSRPPAKLLVGYGCEGSSGKLYAAEESDFPPCAAIEER